MGPDDDDFEDGWDQDFPEAMPPTPEFDQDAYFALAIPGLSEDDRANITREARVLRERGQSREQVTNWICRKVVRTLNAFWPIDASGRLIESPTVAEARKLIASKKGRQRQRKRNEDLKKWRDRCQELIDAGEDPKHVHAACFKAVYATTEHALGNKKVTVIKNFEGLPPIFGNGKSPPHPVRLRQRLFGPPKS
jgi:hypothetical protein